MKQLKSSKGISNIKVPVQIIREGKCFVAYCPALDISTQADTFEKVEKRFHEVIQVFIDELCKMGTMDQYLNEMGWTKVNKPKPMWKPVAMDFISREDVDIKIPCRV